MPRASQMQSRRRTRSPFADTARRQAPSPLPLQCIPQQLRATLPARDAPPSTASRTNFLSRAKFACGAPTGRPAPGSLPEKPLPKPSSPQQPVHADSVRSSSHPTCHSRRSHSISRSPARQDFPEAQSPAPRRSTARCPNIHLTSSGPRISLCSLTLWSLLCIVLPLGPCSSQPFSLSHFSLRQPHSSRSPRRPPPSKQSSAASSASPSALRPGAIHLLLDYRGRLEQRTATSQRSLIGKPRGYSCASHLSGRGDDPAVRGH